MMRLFVAIWPPAEVIASLPIDPLKGSLTRQGVRFTHPSKIHLTLRFLGNVDESDLTALEQSLAEHLRGHTAVSITAAGVGAFPGLQRPRTIWCGLQADIDSLHQSIVQATDAFAETPSDLLTPHLTLARISPPSQKVGAALRQQIQQMPDEPFGTWRADKVSLIQTLPTGEYKQLASFDLESP